MVTSERVQEIFKDCLFGGNPEDKREDEHVIAEGIMHGAELHTGRLSSYKAELTGMLSEFPDPFKEKHGGGWSFLNFCRTADGELWSGEHAIMEQLVLLGICSGLMKFTMPDKKIWEQLPGGMPYITILEG